MSQPQTDDTAKRVLCALNEEGTKWIQCENDSLLPYVGDEGNNAILESRGSTMRLVITTDLEPGDTLSPQGVTVFKNHVSALNWLNSRGEQTSQDGQEARSPFFRCKLATPM